MRKGTRRYILVGVLLAALALGVGESVAEDLVARGDSLWKQRDSIEKTSEAVAAWEAAAKVKSRDPNLWTKIARGYFWIGELTPKKNKKKKMEAYFKGMKAAQKALDIKPDHLPAHYWLMILQGRYTESKGILSGFDLGIAIETTLFVARRDISFHNGGLYRFWGRVFYSIPAVVGQFFKCDMKDSARAYQKAIKISPYYFENRLYLAETYIKMKQMDKARRTLEWIVNTDPEKLPEYAPENRFHQKMARALLAKHFGG